MALQVSPFALFSNPARPCTDLLVRPPTASAKMFSWFYDCPGPPPGSMITDNAPGHLWTTPGPLVFTKSWRRSAKVVQSGSRWSTVVQGGPEGKSNFLTFLLMGQTENYQLLYCLLSE